MKKFSLIFSILFLGLVSIAKADETASRYGYNESFIFTEGGVEFSVYPNGEFDFYYNPAFRRSSVVNISVPHVNISFNSGYNYDPYIQYDDYGAVIQIEEVPIYYDYYGRITQAGNIIIDYDRYGYVVSVGNLFVRYDPYHRIAGYRGYINSYNRNYVYRPWHRYYRRPRARFSIVFNRPYRAYYQPNRITYINHVNYYNTHHHQKAYKNFYRPGQKVRSYNRGRRVAQKREIRSNHTSARRSNVAARTRNANRSNSRREVNRATSSRKRNKVVIGARKERGSNNRSKRINNRSSRSSNNAVISNRKAVERKNNTRAASSRSTRTNTNRMTTGNRNTAATNQRKAAVAKRERTSRSSNRTQRTVNTQRPTQKKQVKRATQSRSRNTSARSSRSNNNIKKSARSQSSARNVRSRD